MSFVQTLLCHLLFVLLGYASGSVMYSSIIARRHGIDLSGHNPGATSIWRLAGRGLGVLCFFLDAAKGALPVALARLLLGMGHPLFALVMAAPLLGHAFPLMLRFRGGLCMSTAIGVLLAVSVWYAPMFLYWFFFAGLFRFIARITPDSLCTAVVMSAFALASLVIPHIPLPLRLGAVGLAAIVISRFSKHLFRDRDEWGIKLFWQKA